MTTQIEITSAYANLDPIAICLALGDNATELLRDLLDGTLTNADDRDRVVSIWDDMDSIGKKASFRALLSTTSKKVLGYGLTVKDGKLVAATTREKKASPQSLFITECKAFASKASAEDMQMALTLMQNILNLPQQ